MALSLNNVRLHVKATGTTVQVPANPRAKLMYYLSCVCNALQLDTSDTRNIARLKDYQNYAFLTEDEKKQLLVFCAILSPDVLLNKVFFQNDSSNEFYDIGTVASHLVVSSSIVIGGQKKSIRKIMTFKMSWLQNNYLEPLQALARELDEAENSRRRRALEAQRRNDNSCVIS
uniref:Uncharacterized protein LOC111115543 n=1 Tax=Crassostrea virginica TaxID=6565 RepID=A0A8B8C548_CRAVI|nr:uncharacterized protein LOC111115543 [Crassostrea virginica]XP_022310051.1 uncharacterized protein LOC111115557 [Crassostrea virginica]